MSIWRWLFWLTVALILRLKPSLSALIMGGSPPSPTGEGLYHLRRIREILARFPEVPTFDSYLSYPTGSLIPDEPGFDLLLGYGARLLGLDHGDGLVWVCLFSAPLLGILLLPLYAILAAKLSSPKAVGYLLPILALTQGMITPSEVGVLSQRILMPLLFALPLLPILFAIGSVDKKQTTPNIISLTAASGLLLGASFFFWKDMTLSATAIALWLGGRSVARMKLGDIQGFDAWGGPLVMGIAAAVAAPLCISHPMGRAGQITAETLSWFQPLYLLGLGGGLTLLSVSLSLAGQILGAAAREKTFAIPFLCHGKAQGLRAIRYTVAFLVFCIPLGSLAALSPNFWLTLPNAFMPWLSASSLLPLSPGAGAPLFQLGQQQWPFSNALAYYGLPLVLWPGLVLMLMGKKVTEPHLFFPAALLLGAAGLMDQTYTALFAPFYGLTLAVAIDQKFHKEKLPWLMAVLALLLLVPALPGILSLPQSPRVYASLKSSLVWMSKNTPDPGGYALREGEEKPAYAVLAPGQLGLPIIALGKRPVLCVESDAPWLAKRCQPTAEALLKSDLDTVMAENKARYLLLGEDNTLLSDMAPLLSEVPKDYAQFNAQRWRATPQLKKSPGYVLFHGDGRLPDLSAQQPTLRLIYEAPQGRYKLFERVEGAKLSGRWHPNHRIYIQVSIQSNQGRIFEWEQHTRADASGHFSFTLPYATSAPLDGWTWGLGPAIVTAFGPGGSQSWDEIDVDAESVRLGYSLHVDLKTNP